jgi:hypothetical protein
MRFHIISGAFPLSARQSRDSRRLESAAASLLPTVVADLQVLHTITVVKNQLSGAGKVEIDLIDFLFKPSSYLYRFNSSPIGLDT